MPTERPAPWRRSGEPGTCVAGRGLSPRGAPRWHRQAFAIVACALAMFGGYIPTVPAQDTPEMLAAMRAAMPAVPAVVPPWDELTAAQRAEIPRLKIGMHRWHREPGERFVLIGGRRVGEGEVAGQDFWLREIRPDGIVLQFRDTFFFHPL